MFTFFSTKLRNILASTYKHKKYNLPAFWESLESLYKERPPQLKALKERKKTESEAADQYPKYND